MLEGLFNTSLAAPLVPQLEKGMRDASPPQTEQTQSGQLAGTPLPH